MWERKWKSLLKIYQEICNFFDCFVCIYKSALSDFIREKLLGIIKNFLEFPLVNENIPPYMYGRSRIECIRKTIPSTIGRGGGGEIKIRAVPFSFL